MNARPLLTRIATLGPIGYLIMPGTMATVISIPLMYWIQEQINSVWLYSLFICGLSYISFICISNALLQLRRFDDPPEIVIDELLGCFVTFWGISLSTPSLLIGFLLFRFFDILKFGGVRYFERFKDAWGIVLDDVAAGILSNIILRMLFG